MTVSSHPLFGRLLAAGGFKRLDGVVFLVVQLPDGSPGTIRADATDVFGTVAETAAAVFDVDGLQALHELVGRLRSRPCKRARSYFVAGPNLPLACREHTALIEN